MTRELFLPAPGMDLKTCDLRHLIAFQNHLVFFALNIFISLE